MPLYRITPHFIKRRAHWHADCLFALIVGERDSHSSKKKEYGRHV